ncbi:hypothetical protein BGX26_012135 [Mortierella sp. AD094]|nr:hypothetical protein BGX26_012135 [Mortierella sp. AD094]
MSASSPPAASISRPIPPKLPMAKLKNIKILDRNDGHIRLLDEVLKDDPEHAQEIGVTTQGLGIRYYSRQEYVDDGDDDDDDTTAVPSCAVPSCAVPQGAVAHDAARGIVAHRATPRSAVPHSTAARGAVAHSTVAHSTVTRSTAPHGLKYKIMIKMHVEDERKGSSGNILCGKSTPSSDRYFQSVDSSKALPTTSAGL